MSAKVTPIGRASYPQVFQAKSFNGGAAKFLITLLFDKTADLTEMKRVADEAAKEKFGKNLPEDFKSPFRDGDKKNRNGDHPEYAGKVFVTFKSNENRKPSVVDGKKQPINQDDPDGFYPGCQARVAYSCYAYDTKGNQGVAFGLQHAQKTSDDTRFDGGVSAVDAFDAIESDTEESFF